MGQEEKDVISSDRSGAAKGRARIDELPFAKLRVLAEPGSPAQSANAAALEHAAHPGEGPADHSLDAGVAPEVELASVRARVAAAASAPAVWRSLDELASTSEFRARVVREFPRWAPAEWDEDDASSSTREDARGDRREFLKLAGASISLAGLTACTRQPRRAHRAVRRAAARASARQAAGVRHRHDHRRLRNRAPGREPHGAADQAHRQPASSLEPRRHQRAASGGDAGPLRSGPLQQRVATRPHPALGTPSSPSSSRC